LAVVIFGASSLEAPLEGGEGPKLAVSQPGGAPLGMQTDLGARGVHLDLSPPQGGGGGDGV
jgi:hypothetical protein